jgi:hypothetical protein
MAASRRKGGGPGSMRKRTPSRVTASRPTGGDDPSRKQENHVAADAA